MILLDWKESNIFIYIIIRKEECEKILGQLEKDMEKLNKKFIYVDTRLWYFIKYFCLIYINKYFNLV